MVNEKIYGEHMVGVLNGKNAHMTLNKDGSFKFEFRDSVTGKIENEQNDIYQSVGDDYYEIVTSKGSDNVGVVLFWIGGSKVDLALSFATVKDEIFFDVV